MRWMTLMTSATLLVAACAPTNVRSQKTPDYRQASYRTIGPGPGAPPEAFRRGALTDEQEARAWEVMKGVLQTKRWEFVDVRGTDLVVHWGLGPAPGDRTDRIDSETLVMDVFERETGERVWFGFARDSEPLNDKLDDAVSRLMLGFPNVPPRPVAY